MQDYQFATPRIRKRDTRKIKLFWITLIILGGAFGIGKLISIPSRSSSGASSPPLQENQPSLTPASPIHSWDELKTAIADLTPSSRGTYTVYIKDLTTSEEFGIQDTMMMTAASLNKLPILAALYHKAGSGEIDLEKIIVPQPEDIQDYGTGSIRYDPPNTPYSIKVLAKLMIQKSDNTAAYLLGTIILGLDSVQSYAQTLGMTQTDMEANKTSARDVGILLFRMREGGITTPALQPEMMGFMYKTDFEDRIPAGVPQPVKTYHKIGEEVGKIHDAGIVEATRPYILAVLSTDIRNDQEAKDTIRSISETVYRFMNR